MKNSVAPPKIHIELGVLLAHPDTRTKDRLVKEGEWEYSMQWVGLLSLNKEAIISAEDGRICIKQLGLIKEEGNLDKERAIKISEYIWNQYPDNPDYSKLLYWLKKVSPKQKGETEDYGIYVGGCMDKGLENLKIVQDLIKLHEQGKVDIPPKVFVYIDRYKLTFKDTEFSGYREALEKMINEKSYPFFIDEPKEKQFMRESFKKKDNDLEIGANLGLFGQKGEWKEGQFQRLYEFIEAHNNEKPNYSLMRLFANDLVDIKGEIKRDKDIPWAWLLPKAKDIMGLNIAQKVIEIFLDRSIHETIKGQEVRQIEKMSLWIDEATTHKWLWFVEVAVLSETGKRTKKWKLWAKALLGGELGELIGTD